MPADWSTPPLDEHLVRLRGNVRVAVAYDEAFHCYFPDTLDMLGAARGDGEGVFAAAR